jgi:hypothetical protein
VACPRTVANDADGNVVLSPVASKGLNAMGALAAVKQASGQGHPDGINSILIKLTRRDSNSIPCPRPWEVVGLWVHFQVGRYAEGRSFAETAICLRPEHSDVACHGCGILWIVRQ